MNIEIKIFKPYVTYPIEDTKWSSSYPKCHLFEIMIMWLVSRMNYTDYAIRDYSSIPIFRHIVSMNDTYFLDFRETSHIALRILIYEKN